MDNHYTLQSQFYYRTGILVLGQLLLIISSFMWTDDGRYTVTGASFMFFSMLFWTIGFSEIFNHLKKQMPLYSRLGLIYAVYGSFGGLVFALEGIFDDAAGQTQLGLKAAEQHAIIMNLVMYQSGPAFPLTLLIMAILLAVRKNISLISSLILAAGAISFPLGRIVRISAVAHLSDVLILIGIVMVSYDLFKRGVRKEEL
ncbi:MAG: hypothetical protein KDC49_05630 [Saprospiraceae bacterium]|nr:hypothetical protein [Saprospiraceae bacterium]